MLVELQSDRGPSFFDSYSIIIFKSAVIASCRDHVGVPVMSSWHNA